MHMRKQNGLYSPIRDSMTSLWPMIDSFSGFILWSVISAKIGTLLEDSDFFEEGTLFRAALRQTGE